MSFLNNKFEKERRHFTVVSQEQRHHIDDEPAQKIEWLDYGNDEKN